MNENKDTLTLLTALYVYMYAYICIYSQLQYLVVLLVAIVVFYCSSETVSSTCIILKMFGS